MSGRVAECGVYICVMLQSTFTHLLAGFASKEIVVKQFFAPKSTAVIITAVYTLPAKHASPGHKHAKH